MKKLLIVLIAAVVLTPVAGLGAEPPAKPEARPEVHKNDKVVLRESVVVKSKLVRLGDLFSNTGAKADITVAYAPAPGKRALFDARWLSRVARAYGLDWRPLGLQDQIMVERESQIITRAEIEDSIHAALISQGAERSMIVELSNRLLRLYVASGSLATVGVEDVAYEPRTGRFTAIVAVPARDPRATRTRVTDRLVKITEVPVLNRRMLRNEVITKGDIKWIKVRADRLRRGTITDSNKLIGMAVKRGAKAGLPLQAGTIQRPILVAKGSLVTIILKAPKMILTAQGKALDNGADGDTVRITNTQSKKVIEAEVTGMGRVAVLPTGFVAMN
jgi:flagella basal body P-ring formation protein FlgA